MSINISSITIFNKTSIGLSSNSARDKAARQQERDSQIDYWEGKKDALKGKKCGSIEAIAERLELLHSYEDQIAAAKKAYNQEQMYHVLDEVREQGENIARELEKLEPKTPEERREEMVEEALGTEEDKGKLTESLEELTDMVEDMAEQTEELMPEEMATEELVPDQEELLKEQQEELLKQKQLQKQKRFDMWV